jgi:hypothetical protein
MQFHKRGKPRVGQLFLKLKRAQISARKSAWLARALLYDKHFSCPNVWIFLNVNRRIHHDAFDFLDAF